MVPMHIRFAKVAGLLLLCGSSVAGDGSPARPSQPAAAEAAGISPELAAIGGALRAARTAPTADTGPLAERIVRAGPGAAAAAFDVLIERRVPQVGADDAPQTLSAPQRAILLEAVQRMPREAVRALVADRLRAETTEPSAVALASVHVLGAIGGAADLQRIAALAPHKPSDGGALTRDGRTALRDAAAAILARDPRAWAFLADVVRTSDRSVARALIEAAAVRPDPRALEVLFRSALAHRDLAPLAVASVQKVGPSLDGDVTREFVSWMAAELGGARREHRQGLLQGIGVLDDGTHAHILIEALEDEETEVREAATWALRRLTGFGYPSTPEPWRAWLRDEAVWNELAREAARAELSADDPSRVAEALRAYAGRRCWRESLAEDVALVLERSEPGLRLAACEVLEGLGALSAIRPMAGLLDAPEEGVREAAWRALGSISGLELPRDPRLALAALDLL